MKLNINLIVKRAFDIISSGILIIILVPIWIVIPIIIRIDSKGPVIFIQKRRTLGGRVFQMYKFRSMKVGAENEGTGLFNFANDSRVTKVGVFLRNHSIDELPQLFNIFRGDMSVVGPRPCVTYELGDFETLNKRFKKRFEVKAGLTGLAQIKGRNDIGWEKKVDYDNMYVDNFRRYGVLYDIKIIFASIFKVFDKDDIFENKADSSLSNDEAAKREEEEIIRIAHLPD